MEYLEIIRTIIIITIALLACNVYIQSYKIRNHHDLIENHKSVIENHYFKIKELELKIEKLKEKKE